MRPACFSYLLACVGMVAISSGDLAAQMEKRLGVSAVSGNVGRIQRWKAFTGQEPGYIEDTIPSHNWDNLTDSGLKYFMNSHARVPQKERFEIGLPMFPTETDSGKPYSEDESRWSRAAAGEFNKHFRSIAKSLVDRGFGSSCIRLGWELNGNWFPWGIDTGDPAKRGERARYFREAWRQIHKTMMEVRGASFQWVWNVGIGYEPDNFDFTLAWPGDHWVDFVSVDFYDTQGEYYWTWWNDPNNRWPLDTLRDWAWKANVEGIHTSLETGLPSGITRRGMQFYRDFATKHGRRFVISEWGIWGRDIIKSLNPTTYVQCNGPWGSGDNPDFIQRIYDWIKANDVHAAAYFGIRNADILIDHSLTDEGLGIVTHPLSRQKYLDTFVKQGFPPSP